MTTAADVDRIGAIRQRVLILEVLRKRGHEPADCLALQSTFENPAAVAVPGVWALKERWAPAFKDLCVFVVADRDLAREKLRARCDEQLGPVARVLHVRVPTPYGDLDEWRRGCDRDNDVFFEALLQAVVEAEREAETSDA